MFKFILVPSCAMLLAAPALAADAAPVTVRDTPPQKERKVCRGDASTGSIMRKRTCRTRAEWAAVDGATAADAERQFDERRQSQGTTVADTTGGD